jgi:hypothetical protein
MCLLPSFLQAGAHTEPCACLPAHLAGCKLHHARELDFLLTHARPLGARRCVLLAQLPALLVLDGAKQPEAAVSPC